MRLLATFLLAFTATVGHAASIADYYTIENIELPKGLDPQIGGLSVSPSGNLFACFHRGEVLVYHTKMKHWMPFAFGLHEPLGILAISDREVLVMQRPELTRLIDSDGDGVADVYETVTDDFGISGNYHEFAFGPAMDKDGNLFFGLNVASNGDTIESEIRGEFRHYGVTFEDMDRKNWKGSKGKVGRMYSVVPYRGWVMKYEPKTGKTIPWASGVRSPNSLGFDAEGRLFVCDNQGDWLGTSKAHIIQKGAFHGHPASLVWRDGWDKGNPLKVPVKELDAMRTRAAMLFPHSVMANSPTQPLLDTTAGKFGPFANQMFVGEMNVARIMRLLPDTVGDTTQGAVAMFWDRQGLNQGVNRFAFSPDGALYVGQTHLSWAGGEGIQRITWNGKVPMDVHQIKLTDDGFALTFTKPADPATMKPDAFAVRRYFYEYHASYGAKPSDTTEMPVKSITPNADGTTWSLSFDKLKPGYVYEFKFQGIKAKDGSNIANTLLCYTCNVLRDGSKAPPQIPGSGSDGESEKAKPKKKK